MENNIKYKVLGYINIHSEYSARELDPDFWHGERQKIIVDGVDGPMTQAQKNRSYALNNPNSVKKIGLKILETRKLSKSPIPEISEMANKLLDKWDEELNKTINDTQLLSDKIQQMIPENHSIELMPGNESKKYPITMDDSRIWKMLKVVVLIDSGVMVIQDALKHWPEKRKKILTINKKLFKPLRRQFNDIAREHNELQKLKVSLEKSEIQTT